MVTAVRLLHCLSEEKQGFVLRPTRRMTHEERHDTD